MFFHRFKILAVFTGCFLVRIVYSMRKCGETLCQDDQGCCVQRNNSSAVMDKTYYNIAMIIRQLSGVLILLLLFAVGYFVHRMLCSRSRQHAPSHNRHPLTTSQEPLTESCTPDSLVVPAPVQLPTYYACKRLPTYEETLRDHGSAGRPECSTGQT